MGYLLLTAALAVAVLTGAEWGVRGMWAMLLLGAGVAFASSNLLIHFVECSEHCQRGTAQNTHLLVWSLAFALGYMAAV